MLFAFGLFFTGLTVGHLMSQDISKTFLITKKYMNFPIQSHQDRQWLEFTVHDSLLTYANERLAEHSIDYWFIKDVSKYQKTSGDSIY